MSRLLLLVLFGTFSSAMSQNESALQETYQFRILHGHDEEIVNRPFQVDLGGVCGGSIIGKNWVLTASHCESEQLWSVNVGSRIKGAGTPYNIKHKFIHPLNEQVGHLTAYDVMLLELEEDIEFSSKVRPIRLDDGDLSLNGKRAVVSGWGRTADGGGVKDLQVVTLTLYDDHDCQEFPRNFAREIGSYENAFADTLICAGDPQSYKDSCKGDSGGPVTVGDKLVAVVSFGDATCVSYIYRPTSKYVKVSAVRDWIEEVTGI